MKKIHYLNLGLAKTGSSALFAQLMSHPQVDFRGEKENFQYCSFGYSLNKYCDYYKDFDVSLNMCTAQWGMELKQIKELSSVATHYSIIFRNPYDFISSLFSYLPASETYKTHTHESFVHMMLETNQLDYNKILERWRYIRKTHPFLILYYDDLINDPTTVYQSLTNFLGLAPVQAANSPVNVTKTKIECVPSEAQIKTINNMIDEFSDYVDRDFAHWKFII